MRALILPVLIAGFLMAGCSGRSITPVAASLTSATSAAPAVYAELLDRYVTAEGVKYGAWHGNEADLKRLADVVDFYAGTRPPEEESAALAWHLNAYNAWILHNILAKYPTEGPLSGDPLFFHGKRIVISGFKTSFDHLEQKIIRPEFKEPRIHFALNCASESCPPLLDRPYLAATLEADLDRQTRLFINENPQGVRVEGAVVKLSKIFDWYAEDFGGKEGLIPYINQYRDSRVSPDRRVEFLPYSWALNAAS